jgi:predicted metal-dependent peptidase
MSKSDTGHSEQGRANTGKRKPKLSPAQMIRKVISRQFSNMKRGTTHQTYRRPSRRQIPDNPFITASWDSPQPRLAIIVDTSGSMSGTDIEVALGVIDDAIKSLRLDHIRVIGADTEICSDQTHIRNLSQVKLRGCGGTSMDHVCNKISQEKKGRPNVIILVTDGGTHWPDNHGVPIIAALSRNKEQTYWWAEKKDWIKYIHLQ